MVHGHRAHAVVTSLRDGIRLAHLWAARGRSDSLAEGEQKRSQENQAGERANPPDHCAVNLAELSPTRQISCLRMSCALIATITVLADIRSAANAGGRRHPRQARTPVANGIATLSAPLDENAAATRQ